MLKTVGSSMIGRKVTLETICLRMDRISAWISSSGLFETASLVVEPVMSGYRNNGITRSLGVCSLFTLRLDKVDIKHPAFERRARVLRDYGKDQLGDGSCKQPFWDTSELFIIRPTVKSSNTHSVSVSISYVAVNKDRG